MAFTGDLEQLPIVDVIQLLNSTRKSGILRVKGRKGESQLVFKDGYIVSANHLDNSVRIGQVLVEMGFVTEQKIDDALQKQQATVANRLPLAIMLIEMGTLREQDAHKALQHLIEMTLVEILTWKRGTFTLDHLVDTVTCDFKYYPERMSHEVNVNTQSILMDALRIFDERMRDGLIEDEPEEAHAEEPPLEELISVDVLGLDEFDSVEATLPRKLAGVATFDPGLFQRRKIAELRLDLRETDQERLVSMLARYTKYPLPGKSAAADAPKVVIFSQDRLLLHGLTTVFANFGVLPVEVSTEDQLAACLAEKTDGKISWLIVDGTVKRVKLARNGQMCTFQLVPKADFRGALSAYRQGAAAVVPRPVIGQENFVEEFMQLLEFIPEFIRDYR